MVLLVCREFKLKLKCWPGRGTPEVGIRSFVVPFQRSPSSVSGYSWGRRPGARTDVSGLNDNWWRSRSSQRSSDNRTTSGTNYLHVNAAEMEIEGGCFVLRMEGAIRPLHWPSNPAISSSAMLCCGNYQNFFTSLDLEWRWGYYFERGWLINIDSTVYRFRYLSRNTTTLNNT